MKKLLKKLIDADRVPKDLVQNATELLSLSEKTVEKLAKKLPKPYTSYDYYTLFLNAREERLYQNKTENDRLMVALRCLIPMDPRSAEQILKSTVPPGNIIHAIERLIKASRITEQTAKRGIFQFLLSCSQQVAIRYSDNTGTVLDMIDAARGDGTISEKVANVAKASFYMLVDPSTVDQMIEKDRVAADDFDRMFHLATSRKLLINGNHARMRRWQPLSYDEIHSIFKNKPTVLAAAGREEWSFGFSWSHSQRHAGGLFSAATLTELLKELIELPPDADKDASREYRQLTTEITGEMHRLCLPINIPSYGSTPVFSDPDSQEKFWVRTGYALHNYRQNYNRLRRIPASDPHLKRDRKKFDADFVDDSHPDIVAWKQRHPGLLDEDYPEATAGYGGTQRGLYSSGNMGYIISRYMRSKPGHSEQGSEHHIMMRRIRRYWNGYMGDVEKQSLRLQLIGILELNRQANEYARALNLYKLGQIEHWTASAGYRTEQYTYETFLKIYRLLHESRLFHFPEGSKVPSSPFYRKPAQFLAASMATAGYNEKEVAMAIDKVWQMRKGKGFMDSITLKYLSSGRYQKSISYITEE